MKKIILLLTLAISLTTCKNNKNIQNTETETDAVEETKTDALEETKTETDFIKITINAVFPLDDTFSLQFKKDGKWRNPKKNKLKITGSNQAQDITFSLPAKTYPTGYLLLVGKNNKKKASINSVQFNLDGNTFQVTKKNFTQFFNPNKFIDFNNTDNSYTLKEGSKTRPFFGSRGLLIKRLEEKFY